MKKLKKFQRIFRILCLFLKLKLILSCLMLKLSLKNVREKLDLKRLKRKQKKMNEVRQKKNIVNLEEEPEEAPESIGSLDKASEDILVEIVSAPFEIIHLRCPAISPLSEEEKEVLKRPLAKIVNKYQVGKYIKDEIWLGIILGGIAIQRVKEYQDFKKSNVKDSNHNR